MSFALLSSMTGQRALEAATSPAAGYGSVSGHVYCVDTNLPARIASVTLESIDVKPEPAPGTPFQLGTPLHSYQTALDGSFLMPKVRAGTYYVVTQMAGYLSPLTQFTRAELARPTPELLTRVMNAVPTVTVGANQAANVEVRLERGATLMGTIRYDDGAAVPGTSVIPLIRQTREGRESWVPTLAGGVTDDRGRYRITGLPPGEYLPQIDLRLHDQLVGSVLGGISNTSSSQRYSLSFYAGDTARQNQGKPIKLQAAEERDGVDITIPVSKLHCVSGTLAEARSGRGINAGYLMLSYEDGQQLAFTEVNADDAMFHFDFVPEGSYTLSVISAMEVVREQVPNPPGSSPPFQTKTTTIKTYGGRHQPLVVLSDITGVVVPVPDARSRPVVTVP